MDRLRAWAATASIVTWTAIRSSMARSPRRNGARMAVASALAACVSATVAVRAADAPSAPAVQTVVVDGVEVQFRRAFGLPPFEQPRAAMTEWRRIVEQDAALAADQPDKAYLGAVTAMVCRVGAGVVGPPKDAPQTQPAERCAETPLDRIGADGTTRLYVSAIEAIREALVSAPVDVPGIPTERVQVAREAVAQRLERHVFDPLRREQFAEVLRLEAIKAPLVRGPHGQVDVVAEGGGHVLDLTSLFEGGPTQLSPEAVEVIAASIRERYAQDGIAVHARAIPGDDPSTLRIEVAFVGPLVEGPGGAMVEAPLSISRFVVGYGGDPVMDEERVRSQLPDPQSVLSGATASLVRRPDGVLVDWYPGGDAVDLDLGQPFDPPVQRFSVSGVQVVLDSITKAFSRQNLIGVLARPRPGELDLSQGGLDRRTERGGDPNEFAVEVKIGVLDSVRSVASGQDDTGLFGLFGGYRKVSSRIDATQHARLRERLPVAKGDVIDGKKLQNYLDFLSRHPGRRVDAAITPPLPREPAPDAAAPAAAGDGAPTSATTAGDGAPTPTATPPDAAPVDAQPAFEDEGAPQSVPLLRGLPLPGTVGLDLLITENNPLLLYVQGSNTGTPETGRWLQRFGFIHSQLTGQDDILAMEFVTASFGGTNAFVGSYDARVGDLDRLRWRVQGLWSQYSAADVGFANEDFNGETYSIWGELAWNFFQDGKFFLDAVAGVRFFNTVVENETIQLTGDEDFLVPYVGLRSEKITREARWLGSVFMNFSVPDVTNPDEAQLTALGRLDPSIQWEKLVWDLQLAFYLEPLFAKDPTQVLLAHELAFMFRGQYAFDTRLIPQEEAVLGGFTTVRGYPQSVVAGDTGLVGTAEYRLHVPQLLGFEQDPGDLFGKPFRFRPQFAYGSTDWDVILRGFVDVGQTIISDPFSFESNYSLVGAGVGIEFQLSRNLNIRLDWAFALEGIEGLVNTGSNQLYFVGTLSF